MKVCIVGYGSIGERHTQLFKEMGVETYIVSRHRNGQNFYSSLKEIQDLQEIDYVWICNETDQHYNVLSEIDSLNYKGKVLVEKPIYHENIKSTYKNIKNIFVTYNLRQHKGLRLLKSHIDKEAVISVDCYVGQYLPLWRPNQDYRESYSASIKRGGGVLRDLSHELDYLVYLFGKPGTLVSKGGTISNLDIDSDDCYKIILDGEKYPLTSLTLNYLDRNVGRYISVHTNKASYHLDFMTGVLKRNSEIILDKYKMSETYKDQIKNIIDGKLDDFCTYKDSLYLMHIIDSVEWSSKNNSWKNL